ncbi:MAG: hypothetical protein HXY39_08535 [Chloroflexi bacterium]|nr:hypothetical protein [Chloroflexota bacterium]
MTTLLAPADAIAESEKLIAVLERHRKNDPQLEAILSAHRTTHHEMKVSHSSSEHAIAAWRSALAQRWACEVAGRRLYKQTMRQLIQHYGDAEAPPIRLISRGGAEVDSSPVELLEDMRRLHTVIAFEAATLPFAEQRLAEIVRACDELEAAIAEVIECERRRRAAVLDLRIAREVYRRMRGETYRTLVSQYGEDFGPDFLDSLPVDTTE